MWVVLALAFAPAAPALADESDAVVAQPVALATGRDYTSDIDAVRIEVDEVSSTLDQTNQTLDKILETVTTSPDSEKLTEDREIELLSSIDSHVLELVGQGQSVVETAEPLASGGRSTTLSLMAYANMSPTSAYANYAVGLLPKVGWSDHYVMVQDSVNSYTFIYGDIEYDTDTLVGYGCDWVRWYYQSQTRGYVMENGIGDVTVTPNGYVVISDLGPYPMLSNNNEMLRKEVGFYAIVAAAVFSLASVWGFTTRLRGTVSV